MELNGKGMLEEDFFNFQTCITQNYLQFIYQGISGFFVFIKTYVGKNVGKIAFRSSK